MGIFYTVDGSGDLNIAGSITAAGGITSTSTTAGLLPPVMTTTQRNAIISPADGLIVYDNTLHQLWEYQNGAWTEVGSTSGVTSLNSLAGALSIVGTSNEIVVTPAGSSITLSTPQAIATTSSPTFAALTLTAALTVPNGGTGLAALTAHDVLVGNGTGTVTLISPSTAGFVLTSNGTSADPTFQASSGGVTSITGTANEVIASASTGAITLSLPQAIATTSTPTFAGETLSGPLIETDGTNNVVQGWSGGTRWDLGLGTTLQPSGTIFLRYNLSGNTLRVGDNVSTLQFTSTNPAVAVSGLTIQGGTTLKLGSNSSTLQFVDSTSNTININAPSSVTSYSLILPAAQGAASTFLQNNGSGTLSWVSGGSGTVNSGTATHLSYYATSTTAVSDANGQTISGTYTFSGGAGALTLSSSTIAMGGNKITGLANGTASTDAAAFGQIYYGFQAAVQATSTTSTATTSSTFQSTGTTTSITPTSASHRVRISISGAASCPSNATVSQISIFRGSTNLGAATGFTFVYPSSAATALSAPVAISFIDSPATTSSVTYTVKIASADNSSTVTWNGNGCTTVIILEEIV
jgi:hypothetical protein